MAGQLFGMPMLSISISISSRRDDGADFALQIGEPDFGLFDARACRTARVQPHLAGIDRGEEILAHQPAQAERGDEESPERRQHAPAMPQRPIQQARRSGTGAPRTAALNRWWPRSEQALRPRSAPPVQCISDSSR